MKIITENSVTLFIDLVPVHVGMGHPNYEAILALAMEDKIDEAYALVDIEEAVSEAIVGTGLTITDGEVYYGGYLIEGLMATRLLQFMESDIDIMPLSRFIERLYRNPSYRAVTELFGFLEKSNLPITEDGYFMAYKKVNSDYTDCYSGKFDNSIGSACRMPRNRVNEDKNDTCSDGLHFAAYEYASSFGSGPLMAIKIDPMDVVSIPTDYNNQKGRCCAYQVIAEVEGAVLEAAPVYSGDDEEDIYEDEPWGY